MSGSKPTVSVVIPTFNRCDLLKEALDSVRGQTWPDWEAVVVDDGSTDDTLNLLAEYQRIDSRIRFLKRDRLPKGACTCRNIGLAAATGNYVVFLDSDDLLALTCLERRVNIFKGDGEYDCIVFQGLLFYKKANDSRRLWNRETDEPDLARFLRGDAVWQTSGPIWKMDAVRKLGGFDENLRCWQDVDIHLRTLLHGLKCFKRLGLAPDYFVRRHQVTSISQKGFKTREMVESLFAVFEKTAKLLGPSHRPDTKSGLRYMLAHAVQYALDNRYFDLARKGIASGMNKGILREPHSSVWKLAYAGYAVHSRGVRGCARLGQSLLKPYQPKSFVGVHELPGDQRKEPVASECHYHP